MNTISRKTTNTSKQIRAADSNVSARKGHKRSTQATISLSSFVIEGAFTAAQAKLWAKECESVASRFTKEETRLLNIKISPERIFMHVAQPQLAVHLGHHFAQSYKNYTPSTSVQYSRDRVNRIVSVEVFMHPAK